MRFSYLIRGGEGREGSKRILLMVAVLLLPIMFVAGLWGYSRASPEAWSQVKVELGLEPAGAPSSITAWGFIEAEETYIYSETGGKIAEILVEEGDEVEAGDIVVRLEGTALDAKIGAAEAAVEVARATLHQAQVAVDITYLQWKSAKARRSHAEEIALYRELQIYEAKVETAEAGVRQAEAEVAVLQTQRELLTVRSPVAGVVVEKVVNLGEVVTQFAPTPLLVVANLDELTLVVYIPESKLGLVNLGQDVEISVDSYPGETFLGKVTYISPEAEFTPTRVQTQEERVKLVFRAKVSIPNPEHRLKAGMPADAVIKVEVPE